MRSMQPMGGQYMVSSPQRGQQMMATTRQLSPQGQGGVVWPAGYSGNQSMNKASVNMTTLAYNPARLSSAGPPVSGKGGVGITFMDRRGPRGLTEVFAKSIIEGSSAALSGKVQPGDILVEVNGEDVDGLDIQVRLRSRSPPPPLVQAWTSTLLPLAFPGPRGSVDSSYHPHPAPPTPSFTPSDVPAPPPFDTRSFPRSVPPGGTGRLFVCWAAVSSSGLPKPLNPDP